MTETLTESFCERCGTRYEFRAPTRLNPLRKTRGFVGGLKNYLTSQDDMSDAMRDAMRQQEESLASAQLEAFHESFNFCIDCRQYTCVNCWNDAAGRCRSCAPIAGTDDLAERLAASMAGNGSVAVAEPQPADDGLQRHLGFDSWPSSDLPAQPSNGHPADVAWPDADTTVARSGDQAPEPELEPEPVAAEAPEPEPVAAQAPEPEPVAEAPEPEPRSAGEAGERPPLRVVGWEPDAPYDVIAPEPVVAAEPEPEPVAAEPELMVAEEAAEPEPEPVAAAEPEPEPVAAAEPEPEPVAAAEPGAEPEPEPTPRPRLAPISETILRFPQRGPASEPRPERQVAEEDAPEVAARRAQLDLLGLGDPGEGPVEPARPAAMPYRSRGAPALQGRLAGRGTRAGGGFWEASAREVAGAAATIGVQNCGQCGLSLSANARFCRRCGTRQAQSA